MAKSVIIRDLKNAWTEFHKVEVITTVQGEDWENLVKAFRMCLRPVHGRIMAPGGHVGFTLTARHSAFFQKSDIKRLLEDAFEGPLTDPTGWEMVDLHGRKTISIDATLFEERLTASQKEEEEPKKKKTRSKR
jgi:hypothetical protein